MATGTRNPEPGTRNPEPGTRNHRRSAQGKHPASDRGPCVRTSRHKHLVAMMRSALVYLCLVHVTAAWSQNLVQNGSFEEYTQCPDFWGQTQRATGWSAFRNSPDYFNACEPNGYWSVPYNVAGFQPAATGQAYCGMYILSPVTIDDREYIGAELVNPLVPNVPVSISFKYVSAGGGGMVEVDYAASGFGIYFTMDPYYITDVTELPNRSALHVDSAYSDTMNWKLITGTYVPDSSYQYIVIGGLFTDSLLMIDTIGDMLGGYAYVYVDDICVSQIEPCGFQNSLVEERESSIWSISPNPCSDVLRIRREGALVHSPIWVEMRDISGRQIMERRFIGSEGQIILRDAPVGPLFLRIGGDSGLMKESLVFHLKL